MPAPAMGPSLIKRQHAYYSSLVRANIIQVPTKSKAKINKIKLNFASQSLLSLIISDTVCLLKSLSPMNTFSSSSSTTTVTYTHRNDHSAPPQHNNPTQLQSNAALTIQSSFRAHRIRSLYRKISAVDSEADSLQRLIQRQETVDAVRSDPLQKLKINESLMALLLTLDSVPGFDPTVREARRKVTRRIVGLQEILDSVTESKFQECGWWNNYDDDSSKINWDQFIADMEESVCRERGGDEMDSFCAQYLGFRCLQRFLHEP